MQSLPVSLYLKFAASLYNRALQQIIALHTPSNCQLHNTCDNNYLLQHYPGGSFQLQCSTMHSNIKTKEAAITAAPFFAQQYNMFTLR